MMSTLALVPVVPAVFRLCGPSLLSYAGAVAGLAGLLLSALLDVLFALGVLTFGVGASWPWTVAGGAAGIVWLVLSGWSVSASLPGVASLSGLADNRDWGIGPDPDSSLGGPDGPRSAEDRAESERLTDV